jgi:cytidylate kinase
LLSTPSLWKKERSPIGEMQATDQHVVIAIDGPAASGKSSVARELAGRLNYAYVNSGAMYRALTWHILRYGVDPRDGPGIERQLAQARITCDLQNNQSRILIDNIDPGDHLRDDDVNNSVSLVSCWPRVRQILVDKMRSYRLRHDLVMEGRDIGSVVFPDTPFKFYIDASPEVRSRRRAAEGLRDEITTRDHADSSRRASPLVIARDADVIDSSHLTIDGVVNEILARLKVKGLKID